MSLFDSIINGLSGSVGQNLNNHPDDIKKTERALNRTGHFRDDYSNGFITAELDQGIRHFQRDNHLKTDGVMHQKGETEQALFKNIKQQQTVTLPKPVKKPIKETAVPEPVRKPVFLTNIDENDVTEFVKKQEKPITHLYKDNKGYMTVGIGHRVLNVEKAKELPLYIYKDEKPHRPATNDEIETYYNQVQAIQHSQNVTAEEYDPKENLNMKDIRLPDAEVSRILNRDLRIERKSFAETGKILIKCPVNCKRF